MKKNLSVLIKPVSAQCNLDCAYCFYKDEIKRRIVSQYGMMNDATMKSVIKKSFEFCDGGNVSFCFQGGEPMLAGIDFFIKFISIANESAKNNQKVQYSIQTNGTIIDKDWIDLFKSNNFLVGVSIDGDQILHDCYRKFYSGEGSFKKVIENIDYMIENKIEVNAVTVITSKNASYAHKVYNFLKSHNLTHMQFIPVIEKLHNMNENKTFSISGKGYEIFLKNLFDVWYKDIISGEIISVRFFENILLMIMGYEPESCDMRGHCSIQYVIESNGNVYPCDFYCLDEYLLGNINEDSVEVLSKNMKGRLFIEESLKTESVCISCKWRYLCRGGCRRYRGTGLQNDAKMFKYCQNYRRFFEYSLQRFIEISEIINKRKYLDKENKQ